MSFQHNDIIIKLDKVPGESNKLYFKKGYSIVKQQPKTSDEMKELILKYNIELYKRFFNISYD